MLASLLLAAIVAGQPVAPQDEVDRDRLMATIAALPTERSGNGGPDGWKGLKATEDLVLERLRNIGYEPATQDIGWRPHFRKPDASQPDQPDPAPPVFRNIIVELAGTDLAGEVLLLSAHLDAAPGAPGADDDGTGVAALLEAARILHDRPMRRSIRLVFFNLEEVGLVGSRRYAMDIAHAKLRTPRDPDAPAEPPPSEPPADTKPAATIIGMASLEMLGYFSDEPDSQKSPIPPIKDVFDPPTVGDFIAIVSTRSHAKFVRRLQESMTSAAPGLKTRIVDFAPDLPLTPPNLLRSDHAPFLALGIPAVMVTDTANFRNPHYHQPTDTAETLDAERFTLVVKGLVGAAYAIAEPATPAPAPPAQIGD
jgi:hypothetical protein